MHWESSLPFFPGADSNERNGKAGLALSIIGIVLSITVYTFYIVSFVSSGEFDNVLPGYEYYYHNGEDDYYDDYDGDDYLDDLLRRYQDERGTGRLFDRG